MSEQIISKQCRTCKEIKPISEFYKHPDTRDGHFNICKSCKNKRQKDYRKTEKGKAVHRRYRKSEKGKAVEKRYKKSEKGKAAEKRYQQSEKRKIACRKGWSRYEATEKGKAAIKRYRQSKEGKAIQKRYRIHHPERVEAHSAVNIAIKIGRLPRPDSLQCHYCPAQAKEYHHYKDYEPEHWLDVIPVCIKCHNEIPKKQVISATF